MEKKHKDICSKNVSYDTENDFNMIKYEAEDVVVLGKCAPWWVYLLTHDERESKFKCYTYPGVTRNPFRKKVMHKEKALKFCNNTRHACKYWILTMAMGPFKTFDKAIEAEGRLRYSAKGEKGRQIAMMQLTREINKEEHEKNKDGINKLLCFSRLISEKVPMEDLEQACSYSLTSSHSKCLNLAEIKDIIEIEEFNQHEYNNNDDDDDNGEKEEIIINRAKSRKKTQVNKYHKNVSTTTLHIPEIETMLDPFEKQRNESIKRKRFENIQQKQIENDNTYSPFSKYHNNFKDPFMKVHMRRKLLSDKNIYKNQNAKKYPYIKNTKRSRSDDDWKFGQWTPDIL